jgi:DNA-binding response OmpR family regulator
LSGQYSVYTLPHVANEQVLLELLRKITPDLFILDCNMPVFSGFDLIPIIRSFEEHKDTPIVFLTSVGDIDHKSAAIMLGARDFLIKPLSADALRQKVAQYIVRKKNGG